MHNILTSLAIISLFGAPYLMHTLDSKDMSAEKPLRIASAVIADDTHQ